MSGGVAPPAFVPAPAPSVLTRIGAPAAPTFVTTPIPGPIGATGQAGPAGPPGIAKGFGTIDYSDLDQVTYDANGLVTGGTPLPLPAGQWVRIARNLQPSQANYNFPTGPWTNFAFYAKGLFQARAVGDVYFYKFTFTVIPSLSGSGLRFSIRPADDVAFDFGPEPIVLTADAGESQTGSETFFEQVRPRFAASGAPIYVMSTVGDAVLTQFSPEVTPQSFA